ncbi:hypothetical protein IDH44_00800 [Paenibacillus sp. IB182496]|uniref:DUF3313 domain-containing protein n=1 Tax=Paenibacillus sabuli TaxID=2772509 RepID=A0A927BQN2_9BACL|nr:hypothetical protein [Paenibacillus sabuli]MBD2843713.1 hypothetical protein [Paenibacillus sabuli]
MKKILLAVALGCFAATCAMVPPLQAPASLTYAWTETDRDPSWAVAAEHTLLRLHNDVYGAFSAPVRPDVRGELQENQAFDSINGIRLSDDEQRVRDMLGAPLSEEADPVLPDRRELDYGHMRVGFTDDAIAYLLVPVSATGVMIGTEVIDMDMESLLDRLGPPDQLAEDGLLYRGDPASLKLFYAEGTKQLASVQAFWSND